MVSKWKIINIMTSSAFRIYALRERESVCVRNDCACVERVKARKRERKKKRAIVGFYVCECERKRERERGRESEKKKWRI